MAADSSDEDGRRREPVDLTASLPEEATTTRRASASSREQIRTLRQRDRVVIALYYFEELHVRRDRACPRRERVTRVPGARSADRRAARRGVTTGASTSCDDCYCRAPGPRMKALRATWSSMRRPATGTSTGSAAGAGLASMPAVVSGSGGQPRPAPVDAGRCRACGSRCRTSGSRRLDVQKRVAEERLARSSSSTASMRAITRSWPTGPNADGFPDGASGACWVKKRRPMSPPVTPHHPRRRATRTSAPG